MAKGTKQPLGRSMFMTHSLLLMASLLLAGAAQASSLPPAPMAAQDALPAGLFLGQPRALSLAVAEAPADVSMMAPAPASLIAPPSGQAEGMPLHELAGPLPPPLHLDPYAPAGRCRRRRPKPR